VVHDSADVARAAAVLSRGCEADCVIEERTRRLTVPAKGGAQRLAQVLRDLDATGIPLDDIGLRRPTLDDVFLAITGHAAAAASNDPGGKP
jgi:ABC-2 type transport system ATP-binding protein